MEIELIPSYVHVIWNELNHPWVSECRHCGYKNRAIYKIGWEHFCYECAIEYYADHHYFCEICGQLYENMHTRSTDENGVCPNCRNNYSKEIQCVRSNNLRTRKLGLISDLSIKQWLYILDSYNRKCAYCDNEYQDMDHVMPVSLGGGTTKDNVVPSCRSCNMSKGNNAPNTTCSRQGELSRKNSLFSTGKLSVSSDGTSPAPCG